MTNIFFLFLKKQAIGDQACIEEHMSIYTYKEAAYTCMTRSPVYTSCNMPPKNSRGTYHILSLIHAYRLAHYISLPLFLLSSVTNEGILQESCLTSRLLSPDEKNINLSKVR